jgi:predicted DNA-binding protein
MRTSKVMAFSVPPEMENEIQKHAKAERRTISEYLREAVRHYMEMREFETVRKAVGKRLKKSKVKKADVEKVLSELRK